MAVIGRAAKEEEEKKGAGQHVESFPAAQSYSDCLGGRPIVGMQGPDKLTDRYRLR